MSTGITCTVLLDGQRFADGSPGDDLANPTALAGLRVTWGRTTTVDQPEPGSCTFEVMDRTGGVAFAEVLRVGRRVDVLATGHLAGAADAGTFRDPGFATGAVSVLTTNAEVAVTTRRAAPAPDTAPYTLYAAPHTTAQLMRLILPPAPFVPAGTLPGAWDDIPTTSHGQTWRAQWRFLVPPATRVVARVVEFTGPWATAWRYADTDPIDCTDASGRGWTEWAADHLATTAGVWLGLEFTVWPSAGLAWADATDRTDPDADDADRAPVAWVEADRLQADGANAPSPDAVTGYRWRDTTALWLDRVDLLTPSTGTERTVRVFSGRITDLQASFSDNSFIDGPVVAVTAADFTADLENLDVGDEPWPHDQPLAARFARVLDLSGTGVHAVLDARPGTVTLAYQDVDNQPVLGLLQSFAASADAVLWAAAHQTLGDFLWLEDPRRRAGLLTLAMGADGVVRIVAGGGSPLPALTDADVDALADAEGRTDLDSCWIERAPVTFTQDVTEIITRAAVTWHSFNPPDEPDEDDDGESGGGQAGTTEHTLTVTDPVLEAAYGKRRHQLTTILATEAGARDVAEAILGRTSGTGWRMSGVAVTDRVLRGTTEQITTVLDLLDGTSRIGKPLRITGMPAWTPTGGESVVPVYLEGGTYQFAGAWDLDLEVSRAAGQGQATLTWADLLDPWRWTDLDPAIRWQDLVGVAPPPGGPTLTRQTTITTTTTTPEASP